MRIYRLEIRDSAYPAKRFWDYHDSFVVAARSSKEARKIAHGYVSYGDERRRIAEDIWLRPDLTRCRQVSTKAEGVVLASFNAG